MAMNGVPTYLNLLSWLVSGIIFNSILISALLILFNTSFSGNVYPYMYHGNSLILWLVLIFHVTHLFAFGMHIAAYFSRCKKNLQIYTLYSYICIKLSQI